MGNIYPRQTILKPVGLVTQPNQYGVYPDGALSRAINMVMRNPGELMQAPDVQNVVSVTGSDFTMHKLYALDAGHVVSIISNASGVTCTVYADTSAYTMQGYTGGGVGGGTFVSYSSTGRISLARLRERLMFNTLNGYAVADSMAPAAAPDRVLRRAGMPQPAAYFLSTTLDGPIPLFCLVGYRFCWRRNFADGYFIRSVPTPVLAVAPLSGGASYATFQIGLLFFSDILAGDVLEMYRTDGLQGTDNTVAFKDPGTTCKLVKSYIVTAADMAAGSFNISDRQPMVFGTIKTPGKELYTNPYQETEDYSNRQPPIAACTASFKGFCFYGRTTDRPALNFAVPGGMGEQIVAVSLGYTAAAFKASAIGNRTITGTYTSGSAVITGVSAADLVGLVPGQRWNNATGFAGNAEILSINAGAGTITMTLNATANSGGPVSINIIDMIEINGSKQRFVTLDQFVLDMLLNGWEVTVDAPIARQVGNYIIGANVQLEPARPSSPTSITVRATNGALYSPPLPEISATVQTNTQSTLKNHLVWSKEQQPEHVPSVLETFVGSGEIIALDPTRDALGIWCTDGFYRLSGDGGAGALGFRVDLVSTTLILAAPQASCVLNEIWYGYTNQGFVSVDSAGTIDQISDRLIGDLLPGAKYTETSGIIMCANEADDEVLLGLGEDVSANKPASLVIYIYNTKQESWTTLAGNGGTTLSFVQAMTMQRSPSSGTPRVLFGAYRAANNPWYSAWNNTSAFLQSDFRYQPIYLKDPLSLKKWIWADYLFPSTDAGRAIRPSFNGNSFAANITVQGFDTAAYARAGVPRQYGVSHAIAPGISAIPNTGVQARFQGLSLLVRERTSQSKKR